MASGTAQSVAPILSIPLELMDEILKLVLVEPPGWRICVHRKGFQSHSLLRTCKQLRSEALKIFFYQNKFVIRPRHPFKGCKEADLLIRFFSHLRAMELKEHLVSIDVGTLRYYHMDKTLTFFREVYDGKHPGLEVTADHRLHKSIDMTVKAMIGLFTIASDGRKRPWEKVEKDIKEHRDVEVQKQRMAEMKKLKGK